MYLLPGTSADIMKVGGYKLSALEIESILLEVTVFLLSFFFYPPIELIRRKQTNEVVLNLLILREEIFSVFQHPEVAECCVLGLPDKDYGDAVCAIIVPEEGAKRKRLEESKPVMSLEELCSWAKEKLAPYKVQRPVQISILHLFFFFCNFFFFKL